MAGYLGAIPVPQATQNRESFTASANQTSFATAGYTVGFVDTFLNGVRLNTADITATNGSDIVLASGAAENDILDVISYATFEINAQTFTGTTTLTDVVASSLDISGNIDIDGITNLDVVDIDGAVNIAAATTIATNNKIQFRDTAIHISSPADGDLAIAADDEIDITSTLIDVNGNLDVSGTALVTGVLTTTAETLFNGGINLPTVNTFIKGGGHNVIQVDANITYFYGGGGGLSVRNADNSAELISISNGGAFTTNPLAGNHAVFNEGSVDADFRVESDSNTHALFVDGAGGARVMIGTSTEGQNQADNLTVSDAGNMGMTLRSTDSGECSIFFSDATSGAGEYAGSLQYIHSNDSMRFATAGVAKMTIGTGGDIDVETGDIFFSTAGKGIVLGATSNVAANTLSDYEEGDYTPAKNNGGSVGYSEQNGHYTKVGELVTVYMDMTISSASGESGSTSVTLPFTSKSGNNYMAFNPWIVDTSYTGSSETANGFVNGSAGVMFMYKITSGNSSGAGYINNNVTGRWSGVFTYFTA